MHFGQLAGQCRLIVLLLLDQLSWRGLDLVALLNLRLRHMLRGLLRDDWVRGELLRQRDLKLRVGLYVGLRSLRGLHLYVIEAGENDGSSRVTLRLLILHRIVCLILDL